MGETLLKSTDASTYASKCVQCVQALGGPMYEIYMGSKTLMETTDAWDASRRGVLCVQARRCRLLDAWRDGPL
jgi:hypothetical protein